MEEIDSKKSENKSLLEIKDLSVDIALQPSFAGKSGLGEKVFHVLKNINLRIGEGEFVALVGESGSGKTMTSLATMHLLPESAKITAGEILFSGHNISSMDEKKFRAISGKDISMIFQEPMTSLNPLIKVGKQIEETGLIHGMSKSEAAKKREELLKHSLFTEIDRVSQSFPHELSGGMKQRVMIASALMNTPKLLIADEPTTALDVSTQEEIIKILRSLKQNSSTSMLLITHDFSVVKKLCTRVYVMFEGRIVEENTMDEIFKSPKHPYTKALIDSIPDYTKRGKDLPLYFKGDFADE